MRCTGVLYDVLVKTIRSGLYYGTLLNVVHIYLLLRILCQNTLIDHCHLLRLKNKVVLASKNDCLSVVYYLSSFLGTGNDNGLLAPYDGILTIPICTTLIPIYSVLSDVSW